MTIWETQEVAYWYFGYYGVWYFVDILNLVKFCDLNLTGQTVLVKHCASRIWFISSLA